MGEYEGLNDQPKINLSKLKHYCITDDINLKSDYWEMIYMDKIFPKDPHRSQRNLKIRPHLIFQDFKYSFYIDNPIVLQERTENFIEMIIKDKEIDENQPNIFIPYHSFRDNLFSEFNECANLKRDTKVRIYEQLNDYLEINYQFMKSKPYWGGLILRNHNNEKLIKFSEIWFANVCRYSKRDQLSLIYSAYQAKIRLRGFYLENGESKYHKWPVKKNKYQLKLQNQFLMDYIPSKYIEALSRKLKDKGEFFLKNENGKYIFLINLLKRLFKKFKIN